MSQQTLFGKSRGALLEEQEAEKQRAAAEINRLLEEWEAEEQKAAAEKKKILEERPRLREREAELGNLLEKMRDDRQTTISHALQALVALPDFIDLHQKCNSLHSLPYKLKYIDRIMYERVPDSAALLFPDPQKNTAFHHALSGIGMPMLCPYFTLEGANITTHEDCTIDGEKTMALCQGRYDICTIFKDRTQRAAFGQVTLPGVTAPVLPKEEKSLVDLQDLDDWWAGEGPYA